jgi:hypothetical protein
MSSPAKILVLRIFNHTNEYDAMQQIHKKYNEDSIYIMYNPTLKTEYLYDKEEQMLEIQGSESYIPGVLDKTIKAIRICLELFDFDILIRSNISSILNIDYLQKQLSQRNNLTNLYGGYPIQCNSSELNIFNVYFASGTSIVLSRDLCQTLVNDHCKLHYTVIDDVAIGMFMKDIDVKITKYDLFIVPRKEIKDDRIDDKSIKHIFEENLILRNHSVYDIQNMDAIYKNICKE